MEVGSYLICTNVCTYARQLKNYTSTDRNGAGNVRRWGMNIDAIIPVPCSLLMKT